MAFTTEMSSFRHYFLCCARSDCSSKCFTDEDTTFIASNFEIFCNRHGSSGRDEDFEVIPDEENSEELVTLKDGISESYEDLKLYLPFLRKILNTMQGLACDKCSQKFITPEGYTLIHQIRSTTDEAYSQNLCGTCCRKYSTGMRNDRYMKPLTFHEIFMESCSEVLAPPHASDDLVSKEMREQLKRTFGAYLQLFRNMHVALQNGCNRLAFHEFDSRIWPLNAGVHRVGVHLEIINSAVKVSSSDDFEMFYGCLRTVKRLYNKYSKLLSEKHVNEINQTVMFSCLDNDHKKQWPFTRELDEKAYFNSLAMWGRTWSRTDIVETDCEDAPRLIDVNIEKTGISAKWISKPRDRERTAVFWSNTRSPEVLEHSEKDLWTDVRQSLNKLHPLAMERLVENYWVVTSAEGIYLVYMDEEAMVFSAQELHGGKYGQGLCVCRKHVEHVQVLNPRAVVFAICNGNSVSRFDILYKASAFIQHSVISLSGMPKDAASDFTFSERDTLVAYEEMRDVSNYDQIGSFVQAGLAINPAWFIFICTRPPIAGKLIHIYTGDGTCIARTSPPYSPRNQETPVDASSALFGIDDGGTILVGETNKFSLELAAVHGSKTFQVSTPECAKDYKLRDIVFRSCPGDDGGSMWFMFALFYDPGNKKAILFKTDGIEEESGRAWFSDQF